MQGRRPLALLLGAITRDRIRRETDVLEQGPGGVVHHAGLALARLGAEIRIVTRVHARDAEELLAPLRSAGAEVVALPSRATTRYLNDYSAERDLHELEAKSDPLHATDIPQAWRSADLIQLGPLHSRDLLPGVAQDLKGFLGVDLQGFFREPRGCAHDQLSSFLDRADVVQLSESDSSQLLSGEAPERFAERSEIPELIVTRGSQGALLIARGQLTHVPARVVRGGDRVGAGDVFLAAYLFARVTGLMPLEAAQCASRSAAAKIELGRVQAELEAQGSACD